MASETSTGKEAVRNEGEKTDEKRYKKERKEIQKDERKGERSFAVDGRRRAKDIKK